MKCNHLGGLNARYDLLNLVEVMEFDPVDRYHNGRSILIPLPVRVVSRLSLCDVMLYHSRCSWLFSDLFHRV